MIKLFGKKRGPAAGVTAPTKTVETPDDLVDSDETIVIDLTGETQQRPEEIRLNLEDCAEAPAPAGDETAAATVASTPSAAGDDTEVWTGTGPLEAPQPTAGTTLTAAWLVVVSETGRGTSYPVRLGRNKVGRGEINSISLQLGDDAISSEAHLVIAADPKSRRFFVVPGDSTNLAYLNEAPLLESRELADKDILQLGATRLVFVQFAGNYVDWE